jgi:hypothetical protein
VEDFGKAKMNQIDECLKPYEKEVDGALFLGVPISQLSKRQLRAALVMMGVLYENERKPQLIQLELFNGSHQSEG